MNKLALAALLLACVVSIGCRSSRTNCRDESYCDPCQRGAGTTSNYAPFEDYAPGEILPPTSQSIMPGPG